MQSGSTANPFKPFKSGKQVADMNRYVFVSKLKAGCFQQHAVVERYYTLFWVNMLFILYKEDGDFCSEPRKVKL